MPLKILVNIYVMELWIWTGPLACLSLFSVISLDKGQYFGLEISLHPLLFPNLIHTCYCKIWCRWMSFNWLFFLLPQDLSTSIICLWSKLVDYIWSIFRAYQKGKLSASRVIHEWRKQNMKGRANRWVIIA